MCYKINITPMSLKSGVLGLPIDSCREWDAYFGIEGELTFEGITDKITITPKHSSLKDVGKNLKMWRADAWQFTINNSVQFANLKLLAVNTYVEQKMIGENLSCDIDINERNGKRFVSIVVKNVNITIQTKYSNAVRSLLKQGIRKSNLIKEFSINWSQPSGWNDISIFGNYNNIHNCLYMWHGTDIKGGNCENFDYIYVGIVGDIRGNKKTQGGQSKRTLAQRLKEEQKQFLAEGIKICKFRYCNLHDCLMKLMFLNFLKL